MPNRRPSREKSYRPVTDWRAPYFRMELSTVADTDARGYSTRSRLYQAANGWLYLHCPDTAAYGALLSELNFRDIHEDGDAIAEAIRGNTVEHWMQTLRPLGVSVSPNLTMED